MHALWSKFIVNPSEILWIMDWLTLEQEKNDTYIWKLISLNGKKKSWVGWFLSRWKVLATSNSYILLHVLDLVHITKHSITKQTSYKPFPLTQLDLAWFSWI